MSYTIGVGVLLDKEANNKLRQLALSFTEKTGNWNGLCQPPHVTVKAPFEVDSIEDIQAASDFMAKIAQAVKCFNVRLSGFGNFGDKVIYAAVDDTGQLKQLSNLFIDHFAGSEEKRKYERERAVFHSTLAMGLNATQYLAGSDLTKNISVDIHTKSAGLGLFLGVDNLQYWTILKEVAFAAE